MIRKPIVWLVAIGVIAMVIVRMNRHAPALVGDVDGKVAPEFTLRDLDGKPFELSRVKGRPVVVNFWATWCAPCREEMPWFVELQQQYGPRGLQFIGVAMDDAGRDAIAKFASSFRVNYPILLGTAQVATDYAGVTALPVTFFIRRDGRVAKRVVGLVTRQDIEDGVRAIVN